MAVVGRLLALVLGGYGLLCLLVVVLQRRLMYFPARSTEIEAVVRARSLGLQAWRDSGGRPIGWRSGARAVRRRVLVFHGNAGSALDRFYYLPLLQDANTEVVLFEYPGYGPRSGSPARKTIDAAADAALVRLHSESPAPVWLLGESLGSGVACALAARHPGEVAGLLLITPFARMTEVAAWHYPWLPVRLLLGDRWDNAAALLSYPGPAYLLVAGRDEVVGAAQGRALAVARPQRTRMHVQAEAGHNSLDLRPDVPPWPEIRSWMAGNALD